MLTFLLVALGAPLLAAWAVVVVGCAQDALAPQAAPVPVPYVRTHAVAQYRARRDAADPIGWAT